MISKKHYIPTDLFAFAYIPSWYEQLDELADMAMREPWKFKAPDYESKNERTPILERYMREVFRMQATAYNAATDSWQEKAAFHMGGREACFHTGLYTKAHKPIYACFEPNKRMDSMLAWYFKAFVDDTSPALRYISTLPKSPVYAVAETQPRFNPAWTIRINCRHVLEDAENIIRIPEEMRKISFLPLLIETAVELGRRQAMMEPGIVVPQLYRGRMQYLLPISLVDAKRTDLAVTLSIMEGYYQGETCLTPQMAYQNARLMGRPTAAWLTELVQ